MSAALDLFAIDGPAEVQEMALACSNMWASALGWYYRDCQTALQGKGSGDGGEALSDLLGSRELLGNLLHGFDSDMDPDVLGDAMLDALDRGLKFKPCGMTRAVPEVVEDLSGLNGWRKRGAA